MKKTLLLALLCMGISQAKAQTSDASYTYTSDSTTLSILVKNGFVFNNAKPKFQLNLKDKWKAKSHKPVTVRITGAVTSKTPTPNLKFVIKLFGKEHIVPINKADPFEFKTEVLPKAIKNNPMIEIKVLNLKNKNDTEVALDAIDLSLKMK